MTYSSVVSRDSVRLAFLIAALNDINIISCDLENAYLNAPCREKIWFEGGIECGEDQGKADPDVWLRKAVRNDGRITA
jgi:hypothetical protein